MDAYLADVTQVVSARFADNHEEDVSALFLYVAEDAYAVTVRFTTREGEVDWTFARDLLLDGLSGNSGEGDIGVGPVDDKQVFIDLRSDDGSTRLILDRTVLNVFVDQMFTRVPAGQEAQYLRLDDWLAQLI